jgi:glutamate dehydrogenase/leucine dehydrogenase
LKKHGTGRLRRYSTFLRREPAIKVEWHDEPTGATGWLIINSLRGGAAGGGTRMRSAAHPREIIYLAKAMELKFALASPPIGGAKCGIAFDNEDPRKQHVLERFYSAILPYLRSCYGTAGDLGIDEAENVIPAFEHLGLSYPQEGIVRGHLDPDPARFRTIIDRLEKGSLAPVHGALGIDGVDLTVADMITGYGVACAVQRFYESKGRSLDGVRVLLEGFGSVGASCALYLVRAGARVVAISDHEKVLLEPHGLGAEEVERLMLARESRALPSADSRLLYGSARERFWSVPADVFVAAAISGTINEQVLTRLARTGVGVIACGANQPFDEAKLGSTQIARLADKKFAVLADIMANCGRARTFSYLMEDSAQPTAECVFRAVDRTITGTLGHALERTGGKPKGLFAGTVDYALDLIDAV